MSVVGVGLTVTEIHYMKRTGNYLVVQNRRPKLIKCDIQPGDRGLLPITKVTDESEVRTSDIFRNKYLIHMVEQTDRRKR